MSINLANKPHPLYVDKYEIYERFQDGIEEYLCIIYVTHHRDETISVSSTHIKNSDERDDYHKQMELYFKEIAKGKHLPITLDSLDTIYSTKYKYKVIKDTELLSTDFIHICHYDAEKKVGKYLGFLTAYLRKGFTVYTEGYFLYDDEHKTHETNFKKESSFIHGQDNYYYLEREFGNELYKTKREIITIEEMNKYNLNSTRVSLFFKPKFKRKFAIDYHPSFKFE